LINKISGYGDHSYICKAIIFNLKTNLCQKEYKTSLLYGYKTCIVIQFIKQLMKGLFLLSSYLFILVGQVNSQITTYLFDHQESPELKLHLDEVNKRLLDTSYHLPAIPDFPIQVGEESSTSLHFPYPIIFIHGLVGSSNSWAEFYNYAQINGWDYGGTIKFCLNTDENLGYSNIYGSNPIDIADYTGDLAAADYYLVNFNCGPDGNCYGSYNHPSQSNQAAINKQGLALREAVNRVLIATGKDKVILFGHSMGGLAARTYLQNPTFWQADNDHHIAKLITSGTPHGGSNATLSVFSSLLDGLDEGSDAVRDLRRSYFYSFEPGVFLFGGVEDENIMFDLIFGFYNYDVNCNGIQGSSVQGLNQKNIPNNLDFTCIIGDYLDGDVIVGLEEAQLKNYYGILSETFVIDAFHTALPAYTRTNFEAFDEPDYYDLSYKIQLNNTYNGYTTKQAPDAEYPLDYDDYYFTTTQPGWVNINVNNNYSFPFGVSILGHPNYNYIYDQSFSSGPIQTQNIPLPAGTYYLEFYSQGNSFSWQYPYAFKVNWSTNPTSNHEPIRGTEFTLNPNPTTGLATLKFEDFDAVEGIIEVYNTAGALLITQQFDKGSKENQINLESFPDGLYFVSVISEYGVITTKVMKQSD
jgi:pimeloyl-ACP methyl ester carboxylesterase